MRFFTTFGTAIFASILAVAAHATVAQPTVLRCRPVKVEYYYVASRPTARSQKRDTAWPLVLGCFVIGMDLHHAVDKGDRHSVKSSLNMFKPNGPLAATYDGPPTHSPFVLGDSSSLRKRRVAMQPQPRGAGLRSAIAGGIASIMLDRWYFRQESPMTLLGFDHVVHHGA
ncbi:hypothetical protein CF336_g8686 [Tilletia laevis]|uniref:Uncharacterized protein n=1 Tax=Tilletia caries TaxID=13290 RepID=A0A8T8SI12_9BASI|nr:hypothetical protein CF336_g8686 [Tilletia laevis]KAE8183283.1 hypothetical protein CF335_g8370 [Tilletia laevis]KAE8240582.1 hypothetical protein A4X03_0g8479 [Tilletia caries]